MLSSWLTRVDPSLAGVNTSSQPCGALAEYGSARRRKLLATWIRPHQFKVILDSDFCTGTTVAYCSTHYHRMCVVHPRGYSLYTNMWCGGLADGNPQRSTRPCNQFMSHL